MGYEVDLTGSNLSIPTANLDAAYRVLCALNDRNDLKSGGRYPADPDAPEVGPREDKWFSWMHWNYPAQCPTVASILEHLGFSVSVTEDATTITYYSNKAGDEDKFLAALAPFYDYSHGPVYGQWTGEDGAMWRTEYQADGSWRDLVGKVVWS